ncbi:MAG: hypothetical protein IKR25_01610 [Muribaculaceae bacterium]|nr:hypothetical protein [Muribaculaceae bacterium]
MNKIGCTSAIEASFIAFGLHNFSETQPNFDRKCGQHECKFSEIPKLALKSPVCARTHRGRIDNTMRPLKLSGYEAGMMDLIVT